MSNVDAGQAPEILYENVTLDEIRKELARTYNAFFVGAPVCEKMIELEQDLMSIISNKS